MADMGARTFGRSENTNSEFGENRILRLDRNSNSPEKKSVRFHEIETLVGSAAIFIECSSANFFL